jgi:hypothetical protein
MLKRKRQRQYTRRLWADIKDNRPKLNGATLKNIPDPCRYIERDTPKRRAEQAKREKLRTEIAAMRYSSTPYLSERARTKVIEAMVRKVGRPAVWHKFKRGAEAQ